jgi:hypothetical protein
MMMTRKEHGTVYVFFFGLSQKSELQTSDVQPRAELVFI